MWSYILGTLGVIALFTIGQNKWYGWFMAFTNECLWIVYGYTTKQYGFIIAAIAYGTVKSARVSTVSEKCFSFSGCRVQNHRLFSFNHGKTNKTH
jgi:hypothetical protein